MVRRRLGGREIFLFLQRVAQFQGGHLNPHRVLNIQGLVRRGLEDPMRYEGDPVGLPVEGDRSEVIIVRLVHFLLFEVDTSHKTNTRQQVGMATVIYTTSGQAHAGDQRARRAAA
jgi:hypothetical protein